jgi:hypothetical protein
MKISAANAETVLADDILRFRHDPLGFVLYAFPWGSGELAGQHGPRAWQAEVLTNIGDGLAGNELAGVDAVLREAIASGHGVGKSALVSWLILWAMSTFEDTRGVVTANTETQLRTKTWPELAKWYHLSINKHWFVFTATRLYSAAPNRAERWRVDAVSWSENNTEAFAGLHNKGKRLLLIFDEASAIADQVWEVAEGALTDPGTEIVWCAFGNPTRNTGRFHECFGDLRHRWRTQQIDSRTVGDDGTNHVQIVEWIQDYGEDSDFVRVRVRGMFPRASALQFIPSDLVATARTREPRSNYGDPLIMSLDVARGGADNNVICFRRGLDARTIPPIRIPGSETRDSMRLVSKVIDLIQEHKPDAFFFDGTGVGGPVGDRIKQLGYNVLEVQFGSASPDPRYANMRAYIWGKMREWLQAGGAIDDDLILEQDLTAPEATHDKRDKIVLTSKEQMKKDGLASPDDGDALAMTFAYPVAIVAGPGFDHAAGKQHTDWDPYAEDRR